MSKLEDAKHAEEVERVIADFESRTLNKMQGHFNRLIYVASLRDYNTGRYHHYGLETRYSSEAVDEALRRCHNKIFEELETLSLESQTEDLISFFQSVREERARLVETWQRLRSYQMLPPERCHPLARDLFDKNIEIILRILRQTDLWPLLYDPHRNSDDLP
jgi:hypothetical protein